MAAAATPVTITDITAIAVSFPLPRLGDEFISSTTGGKRVRAAVVSIEGGAQDWTAMLFTRRGHEVVVGSRERKDSRSWRPPEWVWDPMCATFKPPGTEWNMKARCFMKKGDKLPGAEELPPPDLGEARGDWRARAKQEFPILLDHVEAEAILEAAWAEFEVRLASARASARLRPEADLVEPR